MEAQLLQQCVQVEEVLEAQGDWFAASDLRCEIGRFLAIGRLL